MVNKDEYIRPFFCTGMDLPARTACWPMVSAARRSASRCAHGTAGNWNNGIARQTS